jgi:hypothetical protein
MNYVMMFVGLIAVATIPDDAGLLQLAIQGFAGLGLFLYGSLPLILNSENNA